MDFILVIPSKSSKIKLGGNTNKLTISELNVWLSKTGINCKISIKLRAKIIIDNNIQFLVGFKKLLGILVNSMFNYI